MDDLQPKTTSKNLPYPTIDIAKCASTPAPQLDFVLPGLLVGTVGSIVAPGATGKSWLALQLAALIGTGFDSIGLDIEGLKQGKVLVLAAEDPEPVIWARVYAIASKMSSNQKSDFYSNVEIANCLGCAGDLMDEGQTATDIIKYGEQRLIIVDTLSRWHSGDENSRKDAVVVMRQLERIAIKMGAAIIFLHHTSKFAALNGQGAEQQASRGSGVWVDEARWVAFLRGATDADRKELGVNGGVDAKNYVKYGVSKANYFSPQVDIWLKRGYAGMLKKMAAATKGNGYGEGKERSWLNNDRS